jgi:transposase
MMGKTDIKRVGDISTLLAEIIPEDGSANLDARQRRRLEIAIRAQIGQSQTEICAALGCSKDTARYWMAIAQTEKANSWQTIAVGRPKRVNDEYLRRLKELVTNSPQDYGYAFQRWTAGWLSKHLAQEFDIEISERHINRLLKQMGLSTRTQSDSTQKPVVKGLAITIDDLNPSLLSQSSDSLWSFYRKL